MNKKILIRSIIALSVLILAYIAFWFYKTGQLEKNITEFVSANSTSLSAASFEVSGFPFSQKIEITDLQISGASAILGKNKILFKKINANSSIFKNNFDFEISGDVFLVDDSQKMNKVEFLQKPKIYAEILDGKISLATYADNGYRIFDENKNIIFATASTTINFSSQLDNNKQIISKVNINIKEIENVNIIKIYQNAFEEKIIDGLKTGQIALGGNLINSQTDKFAINSGDVANSNQADNLVAKDIAQNQIAIAPAPQAASNPTSQIAAPQNAQAVAKNSAQQASAQNATQNSATNQATQTVETQNTAQNEPLPNDLQNNQEIIAQNLEKIDQLSENTNSKSDIILDLEYILSPINVSNPLEINKNQILGTQYNKTFKINNFEIKNSSYTIAANGQANYFQDDEMPSGFISIKIDNVSNFVNYIKNGFEKIAKENSQINLPTLPENPSQEQNLQALQTLTQNVSQNVYGDFLTRISANLSSISQEVAVKNQLSQGENVMFDLRREKNLEFVINETPFREIIGKF